MTHDALSMHRKIKLLRRAYTELVDLSLDAGGCDHSVGICQCDLDNLIMDIANELGIPIEGRDF